jgi:hypothetical protein
MSFENYLLSYRAQNQNTLDKNSHAHHAFLETYQKIIEMIDWTLKRYRSIQQDQQNNENDLIIINSNREELYEKKKIARNNLELCDTRDEVDMYRLEETNIENILFETGEFIRNDKHYLKSLSK